MRLHASVKNLVSIERVKYILRVTREKERQRPRSAKLKTYSIYTHIDKVTQGHMRERESKIYTKRQRPRSAKLKTYSIHCHT